jgi:hypothetical protein
MIHIMPVGDTEEHEQSTTCKCGPVVELEGEGVVIHNSFDGREAVEEANQLLGLNPPQDRDFYKLASLFEAMGLKHTCTFGNHYGGYDHKTPIGGAATWAIRIEEGEGYSGFECLFVFDIDGKFIAHSVTE